MSQDLSQVFYDMQTARREIQDLSDASLYDYCILEISYYERHDLDLLYDKLAAGGNLTREERTNLENFYILANLDFVANE